MGPKCSNTQLNMFLDFFSTKNYHSARFFVVTHQTVQLSIGGAKNISTLNMILNVLTCHSCY